MFMFLGHINLIACLKAPEYISLTVHLSSFQNPESYFLPMDFLFFLPPKIVEKNPSGIEVLCHLQN